ncbi:helix-turn-helix domain-containing protein [Anaerotruncus colihominis]|uniref:Helix-turn-helix transcriptional regulator n=1 Tax=Anaerotruncus colihominis TaxID=169435 RepID=A0A845SU49_9FIRM|nr:helix-turn-helix transcriptional regulator [Anaerotruncus colihominis]NDO37794.1 helix-turn-helix transcriptional regulator [Anaerotruncus colihominis]
MFRKERLIEQREKSGYTQNQLCLLANVSPKKYKKLEDGITVPNCHEIERLARMLKISCDYLLGMDLPLEEETILEDLPTDSFAVRFARLMLEQDENIEDIVPLVEKSVSTVYGWRNGRIMPDTKSLVVLANHYSCSIDYLMGLSTRKESLSIS